MELLDWYIYGRGAVEPGRDTLHLEQYGRGVGELMSLEGESKQELHSTDNYKWNW